MSKVTLYKTNLFKYEENLKGLTSAVPSCGMPLLVAVAGAVFGHCENGQIDYPDTPDEYISGMEKAGVIFQSKGEYVTNGKSWRFLYDKAPVIAAIPFALAKEIKELMGIEAPFNKKELAYMQAAAELHAEYYGFDLEIGESITFYRPGETVKLTITVDRADMSYPRGKFTCSVEWITRKGRFDELGAASYTGTLQQVLTNALAE